jgi:cytochrome c biogenesis protein
VTASAGVAKPAAGGSRFDPFRRAWKLLTNVKFALLLVGVAALLSLVGVLIPQMPAEMQGSPAAQAAWLEGQRQDFGPFTRPMDRLELFNVFRSWWFNGLWMVIIAAVTVCTVSRIRPTARSVHRPQKVVADTYFERAHHRAAFSHEGGVDAVERELRKSRYVVERVAERDGATYLFAERFSWSQYGTFVSHLALIMLLVGGLLTTMAGFGRTLAIAETTSAAPLFDEPGPGQIFVEMLDAVRGIDDSGNIVDFRSFLEIRQGDEVVSCETTVNHPCSAFGYRFHQAAFFNDLARMRIAGPDGRLLYSDVLDFNAEARPVPRMVVQTASDNVVFDQPMAQLGSEPGSSPGSAVALSAIAFATGSGEVVWPVGWTIQDGEMRVVVNFGTGESRDLREGESFTVGEGLTVRFVGVVGLSTILIDDMPGARPGASALVQLGEDRNGEPFLVLSGVDDFPLLFTPGQERENFLGYRYLFEGRVDGAGIDIRRDPGHVFIWVAVAMALIGLAITFYVPRRRLWVRVRDGETAMAGIAERTTRFGRELRMMGATLGSKDALLPEDREERY